MSAEPVERRGALDAVSGRHVRLAGWAVIWGAICWVAGMTVAVLTERAIF